MKPNAFRMESQFKTLGVAKDRNQLVSISQQGVYWRTIGVSHRTHRQFSGACQETQALFFCSLSLSLCLLSLFPGPVVNASFMKAGILSGLFPAGSPTPSTQCLAHSIRWVSTYLCTPQQEQLGSHGGHVRRQLPHNTQIPIAEWVTCPPPGRHGRREDGVLCRYD